MGCVMGERCPIDGYVLHENRCPICGYHERRDCARCERPMIRDVCPECEPVRFVDALFALEVQPTSFISPQHYGAWMRRQPIVVQGIRPKINGRWKAIVFRQFGHRCYHCAATTNLTFGHIVPWSVGGTDTPGNGVPECQSCNQRQHPPLAADLARSVAA